MRSALRTPLLIFVSALALSPAAIRAQAPKDAAASRDNDQTLRAMQDEMARSKDRLELTIDRSGQPVRPFYIEYRLLDLDVREITAEFGALVSSTKTRNRFMNVEARVGDYRMDSSNFISDEGFRGFIGSTGSVGIDRDYDSLRQDLWIATDQAFKEAVEAYSRKKAYINSLANQNQYDDFSRVQPVQLVEPLPTPDCSGRAWDQEARDTSAALRAFSLIQESRVTYYLVYATEYLLTSEGTQIRANRSFAAVEAGMSTLAPDGQQLNHYYAAYAPKPADLPNVEAVRKGLNVTASELMALRSSQPAQDYTGPVLFEARAAAPLLAEVLGPNLNGARPPIAFRPVMEQFLSNIGGKSDWAGRLGARVLPTSVTVVDDPSAKEYKGVALLGGYAVDEEGVRGEKITAIENGVLKQLLMSRRPGPDGNESNGHGRAAFLNDAKPSMSNVFLASTETVSFVELKKKFLDACKAEKLTYCLVVREMDNPAISLLHQDDFSELLASFGGGAGNGDRLVSVVYKVFPEDGREEIVRGARIIGLNARSLRNLAGVGNDNFVYNYMQNQTQGFAGTALGAFGSAQNGLPSSIVAPSLLFEELEVRGARGEPKRLPLLPAPTLTAGNSGN